MNWYENYIVLDLETQDDWIEQGRGSGWPEKQAKFLCAAMGGPHQITYYNHIGQLIAKLNYEAYDEYALEYEPLTIIAHNAQYEAGILHSYGFDIESVTWIDTKILAVLYYNNLMDFSLDSLAKLYLGEEKNDAKLGEIAKELGLVKSVVQDPVKIAKKNMEAIFERDPETVKSYVTQDVNLTHKLFKFLMYDENGVQRFTQEQIDFHSDLIKALTLSRAKGVRVHIPTALDLKAQMLKRKQELTEERSKIAPDVNINSSIQLASFFESQGVEVSKTEKGNPSITKEWLAEVDHPLGKTISEEKKLEKLVRDFIEPVLELSAEGQDYVTVYPEVKIYGAAATGRASCGNPNLQQVPKRDKEFGGLIRKMYHPHEGEEWYSLDFSSQEPRLQVHYAAQIGAPGAELLVKQFQENVQHDLHQQVADLAGITRSAAKTINLGLSYGMGDAKLAHSLKLSFPQAKQLKKKFNQSVPFLETLNTYCQKVIKTRGHLKTLLNRKLYNETGFERKALNKLVQGGAADQTWKAIVDCYRAGYIPLIPVHDELNFSLKDPKDADRIKNIMENAIPLCVPSYTEILKGPSWGDLQ